MSRTHAVCLPRAQQLESQALNAKDFFSIAAEVAAQGQDHPLVQARSPDGK